MQKGWGVGMKQEPSQFRSSTHFQIFVVLKLLIAILKYSSKKFKIWSLILSLSLLACLSMELNLNLTCNMYKRNELLQSFCDFCSSEDLRIPKSRYLILAWLLTWALKSARFQNLGVVERDNDRFCWDLVWMKCRELKMKQIWIRNRDIPCIVYKDSLGDSKFKIWKSKFKIRYSVFACSLSWVWERSLSKSWG